MDEINEIGVEIPDLSGLPDQDDVPNMIPDELIEGKDEDPPESEG